ncbi:PREDICTED: probably inactive leucine-rich repeat receptor-like protein kinase At5g48380 [Ipomoea nil]|uniref:probably inactive leucine-rich repeat receptor-like protein kinase At5g48380 n=1 Tax=Ipomoea nil TaxID=35883 RepID=UPI0009018E98|nr:PREDICTED: probably inactive leucine-rich repeat receptor-like protein kinase At5g48380 [Ipomoea nil]
MSNEWLENLGVGNLFCATQMAVCESQCIGTAGAGHPHNGTSANSYANNEGLCGSPLKPCKPVAQKDHSSEDFLISGFASEILTLSRLKHQNLVPILGFCCQGEEKLLVYKYMPNGSLHEWLHSTQDMAKALDWGVRMKIALGVAKALSWLHYSCGLNVVHNGLSSKCILLDQNFEPRISKFWEATIMNPNGTAASSCSLLPIKAAEYGDNFSPYTKDVYCFGIVLLQLITKKEAYKFLSCSFTDIIFDSCTTSPPQIDEVITNTGFDDSISRFLQIAKNCVKFMPNQRPTMLQVYESLTSIAQAWVTNDASEISIDYT